MWKGRDRGRNGGRLGSPLARRAGGTAESMGPGAGRTAADGERSVFGTAEASAVPRCFETRSLEKKYLKMEKMEKMEKGTVSLTEYIYSDKRI